MNSRERKMGTKCPECGVVLYSNIDGIITSKNHLPKCSRYFQKGNYFAAGDKVQHRKPYPNTWKYGDKIFTVEWVGEKSPEFFQLNKDELIQPEINVFHYKDFIKVQ
jgi:hypothetical protein